jgi:translation initiation factor IF-1
LASKRFHILSFTFFNIESNPTLCLESRQHKEFFATYSHYMPAKSRSNSRSGNSGRNRSFGSRKPKPAEDEEKAVEVEGEISSVLAGTMFRVKLASGHEVLAHISGKMRKRFIRLVVGDRVKMEMSPYDLTKARIVFRLG